MERYRGEPLPAGSKVAVIANDALGNFVVSTPLLQMLARQHPNAEIHFYGGTRTWELQMESDLFQETFALHGTAPWDLAPQLLSREYQLVVNLESQPWAKSCVALLAREKGWVVGPCVGRDGRGDLPQAEDDRGALAADKQWTSPDIRTKYPFLQTGFIGEIFARLAYLEGNLPKYRVPVKDPGIKVPDVLIATAASLPEKLWPLDKWRQVLSRLKAQGISVGLIGAKPSAQKEFWKGDATEATLVEEALVQDLRGTLTLPQVAGALSAARAILTIDNGILHLSSATETPVVGLFRHGIHRLWAPPFANLSVLTAGEDREVADIEVEEVWGALERAL